MALRTNNQFTTLESITSERKRLVGIREQRDRLAESSRKKRDECAAQQSRVSLLHTPGGIADSSDKEIDQAEKNLVAMERAAIRAAAALQAFEAGAAQDLDKQFSELDRAEFDLKHAAAREVYEQALQEQVDRLLQAAVKELELTALARAAGCGRAPVGLLASEFGEASPGDRWLREVGAINPELLPADNPQRAFAERARGCPEVAA